MGREATVQLPGTDLPINYGDIFWVAADESKGSVPGFPHPHVVVQDDVFNHSGITTVVVCAITQALGDLCPLPLSRMENQWE